MDDTQPDVCASHKLCLTPSPVPGGPWMSTRGVPSSPARSAPICRMTSTGTGIATGTAGQVLRHRRGSTQLKHRPSGAHCSSPAGPKQLVPHRAQHSTTQQSTRYKLLFINQKPLMTATSQKNATILDKTFVHERRSKGWSVTCEVLHSCSTTVLMPWGISIDLMLGRRMG